MKLTQLTIGNIYQWMSGACYLEIKYMGMAKDITNRDIKAGSSIGKGWLFKWMHKEDSYIELGLNAIVNDVQPLEIVAAKCLKGLSVKGTAFLDSTKATDKHTYNMRYIKDNFYTFKVTDEGYVCISTENVTPIKSKQFNNNFKIN